ncbi:metallophosphoesterase family protein [Zunongwangia atlantica]|uniref:Metallophosphoesterase n=1 Tax=Zunongwangia atlantica 22II14-10F7 TaxID=1185767 RepID=A0A1Y1T390_9FLAO|nr:metallophosphoesterase [Zunongwangia atlantica]ORL45499.1 metallophosphoesterase [Zunongwangia atlantica 22II14-10F7]
MKRISLLLILMCSLLNAQENTQIAFVADIHLLDIYADYENFEGLPVPSQDKNAKIRSMNAQLHSTRLFNENYFVLKAVLDDIAGRGIKLVAFPGDYTDDGQPLNIEGLAKFLKKYEREYGISFFITTGNHDPVAPFNTPGGKHDFLGENGKEQAIFSDVSFLSSEKQNEVLTEPKLEKSGYDFILNNLADFGFFPKQKNKYWESPFSTYNYSDYTFKKAEKEAELSNRLYAINDSIKIPDASYLVEPIEGLWLLAIDGNSYLPRNNGGFSSASIGYNQTIDHKTHLFDWIKKVAQNAQDQNKQLVAFSHYPAVDFNEDASPELEDFLGKNKWQLERVPEERIAKTLAEAGVKLHFAGHMHINDTGKRDYGNGNFLVNIQTPSLAAYIPGYKILKLNKNFAEVETVTIDEVPRFDELFPLYKMEHDYLTKSNQKTWNIDILNSKNYHDFTEYHLENLVNLRFIPNDWNAEFYNFLSNLSAEDFYKTVAENRQNETDFLDWTGKDMIRDFYKIRNADKLAFADIPSKRLEEYKLIIEASKTNQLFKSENKNAQKLSQFLSIFDKFLNGLPANHFKINLETGEIISISNYQ